MKTGTTVRLIQPEIKGQVWLVSVPGLRLRYSSSSSSRLGRYQSLQPLICRVFAHNAIGLAHCAMASVLAWPSKKLMAPVRSVAVSCHLPSVSPSALGATISA